MDFKFFLHFLQDANLQAGASELGGGIAPHPSVCSNGFYVDIWNQCQMQQYYKSCLKSFLYKFGSFEVP